MRFDAEAFRQLFPELTSITTVLAGGGVVFATLIVAYGALVGTGEGIAAEAETRTTAVAVEGPVFKPVTVTQPQPVATATVKAGAPLTEPIAQPQNVDDPRAIAHAVQTGLKRAGCYGGPVNGIWSSSTQAAMAEFTARVNARLPVDRADPVLLALVDTHKDVTCNGSAAPAQSAEAAPTAAPGRIERRAELHTSSVSKETTGGAEHLRYSDEDRRAMDTLASTGPDDSTMDATSATGAAATAAAAGAAASKAATSERRATSSRRKYKRQPSLAREVSKGFRSIQRSLNKIF